jgi:DNA-binding transcriptional MerR regulator
LDKDPDAFRTISEVADDLDVPQHVLRFWESRFRELKPMKRAGGRRYYRPEEVELLRGIRHLLYGEGYTIRGVQRILREQGPRFVQEVWQEGARRPARETAEEPVEPVAEPPIVAEPQRMAAEPQRGSRLADRPPRQPQPVAAPREPRPLTVGGAPSRRKPSVDLERLQAALAELRECRRLLDAALEP